MKTSTELKAHFADMSIEEVMAESKKLIGRDNLLFSASIVILCDRVSEYEFDEFIKTLQE